MLISSEGIAVEAWRNPWRNSAVSGGSTRLFPSDTILAALGDVSSNPSLSARNSTALTNARRSSLDSAWLNHGRAVLIDCMHLGDLNGNSVAVFAELSV